MQHIHARRHLWLPGLFAFLALTLAYGSSLTPAAAQGTEHRIQGTVRDAGGEPLAGIPIGLRGHGPSEGQDREGATASDGTFSFDAPDGAYNLLVATALGSECTIAGYDNPASGGVLNIAVKGEDISGIGVTVSGPSSTAPILLWCSLPPETLGHIQGTVADADGQPVEGVWVSANVHGDSGVYEGEWTASDGTFHLRLRDGVYWLHVQSDRSNECTVSGQEDAGGPGGAVFDTRDGDVADLRITVAGPDSASPVWAVCSFPPEMITTELQPGWNLAGWTEEKAPVADLFDAIPQLEAVYSWDAATQSFRGAVRSDSGPEGALDTVAPGLGLWLAIGGAEQVPWTRPILPSSGLVSLAQGWNLVNWSGHEGLPPAEAFASLGAELQGAAAWDLTTGQFALYYAEAPPAFNTLPPLVRGEAVWLHSATARHWLQPGSAEPKLEFSSAFSPERQAELQAMVNEAFGIFAHWFGLVVPNLTVQYGQNERGILCAYISNVIYLTERCYRAIGHEYSHAIQEYLAPSVHGGPAWLIEGVANLWSAQYHEARGDRTYETHIHGTTLPLAQGTPVLLQSMEDTLAVDGFTTPNYSVAHLAIDRLVALAGEDRTFRYHQERATYQTWQDAFENVFGLSVEDFYEDFAEHRAEVAPPLPQVAGTVLDHKGNPLAGARLQAEPQEGQPRAWATTGDDGSFSLRVHEGAFLLEVHTPDGEGTRHAGWYADEVGFTPRRDQATPIQVEGEDLAGISIRLPDLHWYHIEGVVVGPDGEGIEGIGVDAYPTGDFPGPADDTDADGVFRIFVLGGTFQLHLYSDTPDGRQWIGVYGGDDGFSPRSDQTDVVSVDGQDVIGITIRLPADPTDPSQWRRLEGVVLGPDGQPQDGLSVDAYPAGGAPGHYDRTDESGAFSIAVLPGPFLLNLNIVRAGQGRHLGWYAGEEGTTSSRSEAQVVTVGDEDLTAVAVRLPAAVESSSWRRISGVVLDPEGEPLEGVRVQGDGAAFFANWSVTTGVDGRFEAEAPAGAYELSFRADNCFLGWYAGGRNLVSERAGAGSISTESGALTGLSVSAPDQCSRLEGRVVGPDGEPVDGLVLLTFLSGESGLVTTTDSMGAFEAIFPRGSYRLFLEVEQCRLDWTAEADEITRISGREGRLTLDRAGATGLTLTLAVDPWDLCRRITGFVVGPDGEPISDQWISARQVLTTQPRSPGTWVTSDGDFSLTVRDGFYEVVLFSESFSRCTVTGYEGASAGATATVQVAGQHIANIRVAVGGERPASGPWTPCTFAE